MAPKLKTPDEIMAWFTQEAATVINRYAGKELTPELGDAIQGELLEIFDANGMLEMGGGLMAKKISSDMVNQMRLKYNGSLSKVWH